MYAVKQMQQQSLSAPQAQPADAADPIDRVFAKLMALTPEQLAERLKQYKGDAFAETLRHLNQFADADEWYLQDTRSHVGNDVLWWAKDGKGYTTDLRNAHVFTREAAIRHSEARGCDRPWPKAYIDGKARPAVDMQYIDHAAAMAGKGA